MKLASRISRLCLLLVITAALLVPATAYEVTGSRYIVEDACDFSVEIPENKEALKLDKKLLKGLLGNLLEEVNYITVIELPQSGSITYGKEAVVVLDTFRVSGFKVLRVTPARNQPTEFCFIASDKAGNTTPLCRMTVNPPVTAFLPVAANITLQTGVDMRVEGRLQASDPSGQSVVYEVLTAPQKGDIVFDSRSARFIYTPHKGKSGRDEFQYTVRNSDGQRAEPATVHIRVDKKTAEVFYSDMGDSLNHYAAQCLAAANILRGTRVGGTDFFNPTGTVGRGEFLVMLMNAAREEVEIPSIANTGLQEDDSIPMWMKSYVTAAFATGIVQGDPTREDLLFDAQASITVGEAAVMTANLVQLEDAGLPIDESLPTWAAPSVAVLEQLGLRLRAEDGSLDIGRPLDRDTAAALLYKVLEHSRDADGSLFS
ncbi:MAG: hypothetical protein GXX99_01790 [Clostridiales bacterium]|nr:hypothetical protein [Clostridiales bacterium]